MKKYIIILICLLALGSLMAEIHGSAGEYGYQFLGIAPNPVSMALAGRGVLSGNSNSGWLFQPAATSFEPERYAGLSHSFWIGDTAFSTAYYGVSSRRRHTGLALRNLDYGKIEERDETGFLYGYYQPVDIAITANHAERITPYLYAGANLSVIYEKLDSASALGLSGDLGLLLFPPLENSRIALSYRNLGVSAKMDEERIKLPRSFDLDIYQGFGIAGHTLGVEASILKPVDDSWRYSLAADMDLWQLLHLRAGYKFKDEAQGFSSGFGVQVMGFDLDYAFVPFSKGLSDVHSFGIRYRF
ncbi:MAG: PorV/PorQ family protein [Candidatus Cloacimonadaceae bacterium]